MMVGAGPIALGYFDAGLLAAAAVALGAALQFSVPGVRAPRNPMHLAFAGLCACIAVLALANVALDRATDSAQAVRAVRWMCAAAVLSFPAIVGFVGDYTGSPVRGLRITQLALNPREFPDVKMLAAVQENVTDSSQPSTSCVQWRWASS